MIIPVATSFLISVFTLLILFVLVSKERQHGRRFFADRFRGWLDKVVIRIEYWLFKTWDHFIKYILQLHWYYSLHSVLKTFLRIIVAAYTFFETIFEKNRERTKQLRSEKRHLNEVNHLKQMADHKKDTTLTPFQQQKLRKKKLEEKH